MPTNSEFYERGALDAERDELNPFYYQHYYYYRRGYNEMRRRQRAVTRTPVPPMTLAVAGVSLLVLVVALLAGGLGWLFGRSQSGTAPNAPLAAPNPTPLALATPTAQPVATATVMATPVPKLTLGGRARAVNLHGSPLRARKAPGLAAAVTALIREGTDVNLREGPTSADGLNWWRVEAAQGSGWVAERLADGTVVLEPQP